MFRFALINQIYIILKRIKKSILKFDKTILDNVKYNKAYKLIINYKQNFIIQKAIFRIV